MTRSFLKYFKVPQKLVSVNENFQFAYNFFNNHEYLLKLNVLPRYFIKYSRQGLKI